MASGDNIDWRELDRRRKARGDEYDVVQVPDPEKVRASHQVGAGATVDAVRVSKHPLEKLNARKSITLRQYDAGTRLRDAYERAFCGGQSPDGMSVTAIAYGSRTLSEAQLDAGLEVREIMLNIGKSARPPLQWIVLGGYEIQEYATAYGITPHNAKGRLDMALDLLADHYRM